MNAVAWIAGGLLVAVVGAIVAYEYPRWRQRQQFRERAAVVQAIGSGASRRLIGLDLYNPENA